MTAPAASPWTSTTGLVLPDLVPAELRRRWVDQRHCPDTDIYRMFHRHVRDHPDRVAVIDAEGSLGYATLDRRVRRAAAALAGAGLGPRDVVAIQLGNGWRAPLADLAVAAIGAVALPIPGGRGRRDRDALLRRSRASALLVDGPPADRGAARPFDGPCPDLPALRLVAEVDSAGRITPRTTEVDRAGLITPRPAIDPEWPARILVSSGSEAEPKMVAYSHNALLGGRGNYLAALHAMPGPMRNLVLVPLASAYGSLGLVTLARHGGTLLIAERFAPALALDLIRAHRPGLVFAVPTMLARMAAADPHLTPPGTPHGTRGATPGGSPSRGGLPGGTTLVSSGAPLPPATARICRERFGRPVVNVYGSADGVNCHPGRPGRPGTRCADPGPDADPGLDADPDRDPDPDLLGRPDPAVAEITVRDERGEVLPPGRRGEIWARGPMTPLCYVGAPELDARYRPAGGWVRTGDVGVFTAGGTLRIAGRLKRVVLRGGESISPAEVERELAAHPLVVEACCVGLPDDDLGERLCACLSQRAGTPGLTLAEITAFLERDRGLDRRRLPEAVLVLPRLPTGPTGKVCVRTLTALATRATAGSRSAR